VSGITGAAYEEVNVMSEMIINTIPAGQESSASQDDEFPLSEWFDLSKRISKAAQRRCEIAMAEHAFRSGEVHMPGFNWGAKLKRLHGAIQRHNLPFILEQARKAVEHGRKILREMEVKP
jgi:hypothetical protein